MRKAFLLWLGVAVTTQCGELDQLRREFLQPPEDARIMMRWWWFGPAVTKAELEREMRQMKAAGIGGFEVQPVYPLALDDPETGIRNLPYLSPDFLDTLRFTAAKAKELGLRMDLTLGTGWPYGGPSVPVTQAAGKLRLERVQSDANANTAPPPHLTTGEKLIASFPVPVHSNGAGNPQGVLFFISSRTGQMVKRASAGAEGFVLDHYGRTATTNYLENVADRLMQALKDDPPHAVFCDSLEVFGSDWTDDFLEEFQRRRGYDLKSRLPALALDAIPQTRAIRHDWGKTLTELLNERFLAPIAEWSKKNKTLFRIQNYGVPPAVLSSNVYADLPEGEGSHWNVFSASRWASSAAHLYGRDVTSSETWTWLHSPSFRATPLDLKAEADRHFLQGINQLVGHGWPYSPPAADYPGWRLYAAAALNENNPWWTVMPDLSLYLQRLSFLLRQGKPANDVALYLPNSDAWASFTLGRVHMIDALRERLGNDVIEQILEAGYNLDFFDDGTLEKLGRVEKGALVLGGYRYRIVILPNIETIPVRTLATLDQFARSGGVLVATRRLPEAAPGFLATASDHDEIRELVRRLFKDAGAAGRLAANENRDLGGVLTAAVQPDVSLSPPVADIGFIHRTLEKGDIYFLANTGNQRRRVKAKFRVTGLVPQRWDSLTGKIAAVPVVSAEGDGITVGLELDPYGSQVFVFSTDAAPAPEPQGVPEEVDLSKNWDVSFGDRRVPMPTLRSWTADPETRYYSGSAIYEKHVSLPEAFLSQGTAVKLNFGEGQPDPATEPANEGVPGMRALLKGPVREAAVVYINGKRAGSVWCPPYSVEVAPFLHPGDNHVRIEVANLATNHMAGRPLPDYRLLNLRYGERFSPQDMDKVRPVESGLLGSVRLIRH